MSSLRLALKQSLQESGGGAFSSGHGDKKKRKKKKIIGGSSSNNTNSNSGTKKGRDSKPKRGRPRKHPRSYEEDDDETTLGEDPQHPSRRVDRQRKTSKHNNNNMDDEEEDDFYSENEFSYTEDYSEEDDVSDDDVSEDADEESPYRSRSRSRDHEDEEGEEDETMHSDEDDLHPQPSSSSSQAPSSSKSSSSNNDSQKLAAAAAAPLQETNDTQAKSDGNAPQTAVEDPNRPDIPKASKEDAPTLTSLEAKSASTETPIPSTAAPTADEEMARKKLKLLKLKKKLEKNSAASKIQTQWKKKKDKSSSPSTESKGEVPSAPAVATDKSTLSNSNENQTTRESKGDTASTPTHQASATEAEPSKLPPAGTESQPKVPQGKDESISEDAADTQSKTSSTKKEIASDAFAAAAAAAAMTTTTTKPTSTSSSAAAGDGGNTADAEENEEPTNQPMKKKKKKKNNNGIVPPPTREVKQWAANMSIKKSRKYIQVGMRVKVRFAIPTKVDGEMKKKKKFYGGKVTAISKQCTKIRIKYDDGTSEVSKFPDGDVYVDAVDNGEHAVPADKFIPPPPEEPEPEGGEEEAAKPAEEQEEGEIPNPPSAPAAPASAAATEPEEGEVEEDTKPKARAMHVEAAESRSTAKQSSDEPPTASAKPKPSEPPMNVPSTPPPASSSNEKAEAAAAAASNADGSGDVPMEPAPSPSQEEGELSPGITVSKSSENAADSQLAAGESKPLDSQLAAAAASESKPLSADALLPSNLASETATTEPIKFAPEKPLATTKGDASTPEGEASNDKTVPEGPPKTKKLSIRIPSNSLASIKSLSSPKTAAGAKSPTTAPASSNDTPAASNVDDVLKDTPETKKEIATAKRKRIPDDAVPSLDVASGQEPSTKRRIKVAIGKILLESTSKSQSSDGPSKSTEEGLVVEEELAPPVAEEPISGGVETKKKKKKGDRAKSPRPKSPIPSLEQDKNKSTPSEALAGGATPKQKIGSKGSAFSAKKSAVKEEVPQAAELLNVSASVRTGRKAAEEAKEKLSVKQKAKLSAKEPKEKETAPLESGKKKKKRAREKEEEEVEPSELEWVQCDACKKWRVLPDNVRASSLPDLWYCKMNVYDPKRSSCEAPEQNMKQLLKERRRKRDRKRAKLQADMAEAQQEKPTKKSKVQDEETAPTTTKKKGKNDKLQPGGTPRSVSPKPTKSAKSSGGKSKESGAESKKAIAEAKRANLDEKKKSKGVSEDQPNPTDSGSDTQKEVKKKGKKGKKESQDNTDTQDVDDSKKNGKKRGRPSRNQTTGTTVPTSSSNNNEDEDNVEWVQCDKCQKWRKLPPDISADELPEIWNCSMNTWNPASASCEAAEDKADAHHQEVGASEWHSRQLHAGKYSYRHMIFGTGRKNNRPLSERARAAESLFIQPSTDEENPHPTTQYTKSSAFLPRLSNFQRNNAVEENTLGIFDVLRHSNLWEDLRTMDMTPSKVLSSSTSNLNIPGQKLKTYDGLTDDIKHAMQDVVLQTLEFGCLTGDEVIGKAQWFPYETSLKGAAGIRGYCNEDIIIHTLLDLVRDGIVEMATLRDPYCPVSQWVPRYRRVGTRRAHEAVEAIKASRCMKIAKPWKQRPSESTTTTKWVTGQQAN